jgi:hypothetical protein
MKGPFRFHDGVSVWISWFEQWKSLGSGRFELTNCGLTLYLGFPTDVRKTQIVRAEWQEIGETGTEAAQPHWHFDLAITSESQFRPEFGVSRSVLFGILDDIAVEPVTEEGYDLAPLHFGMAGWHHGKIATDDEARHWQLDLRSTTGDLVAWVARTVAYLAHQMERFPPLALRP